MNKKTIMILIIIILTATIAGAFWFFQKNINNVIPAKAGISQKDNAETINEVNSNNQEKTEITKEDEELNFDEVDTSDWKTYRNEEFRFDMRVPGDMHKWKFTKKKIEKVNSFYNSNNEYIIDFNYVLDNIIARDPNDLSLGYINNMSIWYIDIVPIDDYVDNVCNKNKKPMCRQGKILGKNDKFVFVSGFVDIEGVGYLCNNQYNKQVEFCNVDNYFGLKNINNLINFRVL